MQKGTVAYLINILLTAGKVIEPLLEEHPKASFALAASRSFDSATNTVEPYEKISCYLLLNKKNYNLEAKRDEIESSFRNTYDELLNVQLD